MQSSWSRSTDVGHFGLDHTLEYRVRVRGTLYLWGSAGITQDPAFATPVLLHFRNDPYGEVVTIGTKTGSTVQPPIGALQPGEFFSVAIQNISGVYATCASGLESTVYCVIKAH